MPLLDVADQSLVALPRVLVAADPRGPCRLGRWVPGLALQGVLDRGAEGRLWRARANLAGREWAGTAEVWLEPWHDATVVHLYVRLDPLPGAGTPAVQARTVDRLRNGLVDRWKHRLQTWRDEVEAARAPGSDALKMSAGHAEG
jgi:hypothetical protein